MDGRHAHEIREERDIGIEQLARDALGNWERGRQEALLADMALIRRWLKRREMERAGPRLALALQDIASGAVGVAPPSGAEERMQWVRDVARGSLRTAGLEPEKGGSDGD